jgi:hypothetical protein
MQETGVVEGVEEGLWRVRTGGGVVRARRAASCLIEPAGGDLALVALTSSGAAWILALLERSRPGRVIAVEGDLDVRVTGGRLSLASDRDLDVVSGQRVGIVSPAFELSAGLAKLFAGKLGYVGDVLSAEIGKARIEGGVFERIAERVSERVKRCFRMIEEIDQTRAKRVDVAADQLLRLHGGCAAVTAKALVKMDAEQVHVG